MTSDESLFELLNALLAEGTSLTNDISEAVQAPGFDVEVANACLKANQRYLETVSRVADMLERENLNDAARNDLTDILRICHEHGAAMRTLLESKIGRSDL